MIDDALSISYTPYIFCAHDRGRRRRDGGDVCPDALKRGFHARRQPRDERDAGDDAVDNAVEHEW